MPTTSRARSDRTDGRAAGRARRQPAEASRQTDADQDAEGHRQQGQEPMEPAREDEGDDAVGVVEAERQGGRVDVEAPDLDADQHADGHDQERPARSHQEATGHAGQQCQRHDEQRLRARDGTAWGDLRGKPADDAGDARRRQQSRDAHGPVMPCPAVIAGHRRVSPAWSSVTASPRFCVRPHETLRWPRRAGADRPAMPG